MQKLDGLTRVITESMNEMASGAVQINNAVQEVSEITLKNKQNRHGWRWFHAVMSFVNLQHPCCKLTCEFHKNKIFVKHRY